MEVVLCIIHLVDRGLQYLIILLSIIPCFTLSLIPQFFPFAAYLLEIRESSRLQYGAKLTLNGLFMIFFHLCGIDCQCATKCQYLFIHY